MQGFYTRIENDALDIAARLKEIDDGYFIVYNGYFKRLEVHNKKQGKNTFCLVVPCNRLNARTVELVRRTRAENADRLLAEIDFHNARVEEEALRRAASV